MDVDSYVTPRKKLLGLLLRGRENWKQKVAMAKYEKKLTANQSRAVERSRDKWRALAEERQARIKELEQEMEAQKKHHRPPRVNTRQAICSVGS
jgi:hypothetical protein